MLKRISLVAMTAAMTFAARGNTCTDVPTTVTVTAGTYLDPSTTGTGNPVQYTSAIIPDGKGVYINGSSGVIARLNCGTGDATLLLSRTRTLAMSFQNVVDTNPSTPAFALSSTPVQVALLNVHDVWGANYNANATYDFTTTFGMNLTKPNSNFYIRMENPLAAVPTTLHDANANSPCGTSLVHVHHVASTSTTGTPNDYFVAWPDSLTVSSCSNSATPIQVGSLIDPSAQAAQNWGQFSVPFLVTINRK
jgi:hypothetical protein